MAEVPAVVHAEVGQVFEHDDVVARGQFTDHLQLFLFQTDPGRIVGVGVDDGGDVARGEFLLQPCAKFLRAAVGVDVEFPPLYALDAQLGLLDGEARIDEQDLILARNALGAGDEGPERSRHRTSGRNAAPGVDVDIDKCLDELGGGRLQFRHARGGRVLGPDARIQCPLFRLDAEAVDRQAGRSLVHADEGDAGFLFEILRDQQRFPDRGLGQVGDVVCRAGFAYEFFAENPHALNSM